MVAAGAGQSCFGNDHFAPFAPSLKTVDDALELRGRIFGAFELAELGATRGEDVSHLLTFAVVGTGPTGSSWQGRSPSWPPHPARRLPGHRSGRCGCLLLDAGAQVLAPFGANLGARARRSLERLGVEVVLGVTATNVDDHGLDADTADGSPLRIEAATTIWAAGVSASALGRTLAEQTRGGPSTAPDGSGSDQI